MMAVSTMKRTARVVVRSGACSTAAVGPSTRLAPSNRAFHASHRRQDETPSPGTPLRAGPGSSHDRSSSSSSRANSASGMSIVNIVIASAAIVIAAPHALDLYGRITGTTPSRSTSSSIPGKLEPYTHHPLPLVLSAYYPDPASASVHKLLHIGLPASLPASGGSETDELKKALRIRSVYIKEPSLVIERAYTPLYDTLPGSYSAALQDASAEERQRLDLLVKRYPDGELGKMLHRAVANPTVPQLEVRGPVDTWSFERDSVAGGAIPERIVMVVGGTGVTPAYQLVTNLFGGPTGGSGKRAMEGGPMIDVVYATQSLENALLLPELHALAANSKDRVTVSLFAEHLAGSPSPSTLSPTQLAALGPTLKASTPSSSSRRSWLPSLFSKASSSLEPKLHLTSSLSPTSTTTIPVYESRITQQHLESLLSPQNGKPIPGRTLILVSGPDGMVEAIAGSKSRDGQSQGSLSGILAKIGCRQEDVFKL
ncbi:NADH-cytochrome b5 reductase 3 [Pseudozyma hubeiensis SY62]|uniref:NADH-cytochrome b5 reductase 3 n=1 Tax=Pseudozyma hubeiensis (strain SY62) TaxID=1305764 RepID=R9PDJ5_PSEHS|nr:NADH-cytochrome b5 reductase 3 [Pseudozyma hubeiensis SY62]GAC99439.1 NADH-cytochrome b5 reductase 3 [Pseudozyma hubeiensis SY62]